MSDNDIFDCMLSPHERRKTAKAWLRSEQRNALERLRKDVVPVSPYREAVTLIAYTFPEDEREFDYIEFAIRYSWRCIGRLKTVVIADRETETLRCFAESCSDVEIQIESTLKPGSVSAMSSDCIERLHKRFSTKYCLIVQDDGFPLNSNLGDFLGKYDYIGAPTVRDVPEQYLVDIFRCACLNGGFSLRSKSLCEEASKQWKFFRKFVRVGSVAHAEDVFYTQTACLNPFYRFKFKWPSSKAARRFSMPDFDGVVDISGERDKVFGAHGHTALWQLLPRPLI